MKTPLSTLLISICMSTCVGLPAKLFAQTDSLALDSSMTIKPEVFRKNSVKINLSSLALNNYNFNYERMLSRKISFVAGYRTMKATSLGELSLADKIATKLDNEDLKNDLNQITAGNTAYTGEFRFYGGKHAGARGFYISLYGRYAKFDVTHLYTYESESQSYNIPLKSNFSGYGGGIMLGSQWLIAKRINFDWYIIGAQYGKLTGDTKGNADLSSLSSEDREDLKFSLQDTYTITGDSYLKEPTVTDQGVNSDFDGPFFGIRGLGFSLGIAF